MHNSKNENIVWGKDPNFFGPRSWFRNSLILKQILKYKKGGKLLDYGCGTGDLTSRVCKKGFHCIGVDSSPLVLKFIKNKFFHNNFYHIKFVLGNESYLEKIDEKFDVIICGETLEHIKDDRRVVHYFYKNLKKNGICVITVPAHPERWSESDEYAGHFRRYKKRDLVTLFKNEGFLILDVFYWGYPLAYFWEKYIFQRLFIYKKSKKSFLNYKKFNINKIFGHKFTKILFSKIFYFDQLFNYSEKGIGLLLVAKKK